MKNEFDNKTTNQLKEEYICFCFGTMIYGTKTENQRHKIATEIERREKIIKQGG